MGTLGGEESPLEVRGYARAGGRRERRDFHRPGTARPGWHCGDAIGFGDGRKVCSSFGFVEVVCSSSGLVEVVVLNQTDAKP